MTRMKRWVAAGILAGVAIVCVPGADEAQAATPVLYSVVEGRGTGQDVIVLVGSALTAIKTFELVDNDGLPVVTVTASFRGKNIVVLSPDAALAPGAYHLKIGYGKTGTQSIPVTYTGAATFIPPAPPVPEWTTSGSDVYRASGRVGIGTSTPAATLDVAGTDGVVFRGTEGVGVVPVSGSGARMMWYPGKGAFRAGIVDGTQWDEASIAPYSTAMGFDTVASNNNSVALGERTTASGLSSIALGRSTTASGGVSVAMGYSTFATVPYAVAMGSFTNANGNISTSMGYSTTAQAFASVVLGQFNVITGTPGNWVTTEPVLVVGNGTSAAARANAFTLLKNGNLTIAGTLTQNSDARLKKEIAPLAGVLPKLAKVRGVSYAMKDEDRGPAGRQIGFLAQEVRDAFPELVQEDSQGTLSVAYANFSAVLLEAVKEQQAQIDARDRELAALREKVAAMDARLAAIEKALPPAGAK